MVALHSLLVPTQNGLLTLVAGSGDMNGGGGMEQEERQPSLKIPLAWDL